MNTKYSLGGAFGTYSAEDDGGSVNPRHERGNREKKAFLVSGSETGEVLWWDVQSKEVLQREAAHDGVVLDVDTWDGGVGGGGGYDGEAEVDAEADADDGGVRRGLLLSRGGLAVSCGVDRTVRVWAATREAMVDGDGDGDGEGAGDAEEAVMAGVKQEEEE